MFSCVDNNNLVSLWAPISYSLLPFQIPGQLFQKVDSGSLPRNSDSVRYWGISIFKCSSCDSNILLNWTQYLDIINSNIKSNNKTTTLTTSDHSNNTNSCAFTDYTASVLFALHTHCAIYFYLIPIQTLETKKPLGKLHSFFKATRLDTRIQKECLIK